jgi:hypothetical protein
MKSINFSEATNKIAEKQEEFNTVISQWNPEEQSVNMCFELDEAEFAEISRTRKLWYKQLIGNRTMNPMRISPFKKQMIEKPKEIESLNDIDLTTHEGKLFLASLAMLTTAKEHQHLTPDEMIAKVNSLRIEMDMKTS